MIKIDKGVPLPPSGLGSQTKYPFRSLAVGDSFFAPGMKQRSINPHNLKKATGFRFATRSVTENGVKGVRVWRVA